MRPHLPFSRWRAALAALLVLSAPLSSVDAQSPAELDGLYALADSIRAARQPQLVATVPDYSPQAIGRWTTQLASFRTALSAIGTEAWSVPNRIDYILVRTQLNAWDFELRVQRPWARDPGHWVDLIARLPYIATPIASRDEPRVQAQLRAVPATLEAARRTLTQPSAELAGIALFHLTQSDGVNQGEPRRDPPPAGVIGWYEEFAQRISRSNPTLAADARNALAAVRAFRDWLQAEQPNMKEPAYIGLEEYAWYVRNVRLLPLTVEQIRDLGERELERARMLLALERHRNRELPDQVPVTNAAEHEQRTRAAETLIRDFTRREHILTIPADIPPIYETDAFFIDRSAWGGARHFWEEITYRDPLNNHIHASIPGHRFDGTLQRRHPSPIRRAFSDGTRAEGWSFYIEEMYLQAGLLQERPRTRELFYIAQLKRAARIRAELAMQTGRFTLQQAIDFLNAEVPLMESNLARYDLAIYLRRPAYGMNYTVGKAQMERLLSDYSRNQGDAFSLGAFHDAFLASGSIPITLIRWQLTGLDDEVRALGLVP